MARRRRLSRARRVEKLKMAGFWGTGEWGEKGSVAHAGQLKRRGFKGVEIKKVPKKGLTVYYKVKGRGQPLYMWNPRAKGSLKYGD